MPFNSACINHITIKNVMRFRLLFAKKSPVVLFDRASLYRRALRLHFTPRSYVWIQLTHTFAKANANILRAAVITSLRLLYDYFGHFFYLMREAFLSIALKNPNFCVGAIAVVS